MSLDEFSGPDLAGVVADAKAVGLGYVVIGTLATGSWTSCAVAHRHWTIEPRRARRVDS
jgi:hypothetical protein